MPTEGPNPESLKLDNPEMAVEISSSKEDLNLDPDISETRRKLIRNKRGFFFLRPSSSNFVTTVTSWSVVSTIFTSTFIPAADFLCVPPGYQICV